MLIDSIDAVKVLRLFTFRDHFLLGSLSKMLSRIAAHPTGAWCAGIDALADMFGWHETDNDVHMFDPRLDPLAMMTAHGTFVAADFTDLDSAVHGSHDVCILHALGVSSSLALRSGICHAYSTSSTSMPSWS
jgi:hypothetical protein